MTQILKLVLWKAKPLLYYSLFLVLISSAKSKSGLVFFREGFKPHLAVRAKVSRSTVNFAINNNACNLIPTILVHYLGRYDQGPTLYVEFDFDFNYRLIQNIKFRKTGHLNIVASWRQISLR